MKGTHRDKKTDILKRISVAEQALGPFLGLTDQKRRDCWADQIISSLRRIAYTETLRSRDIAPSRADPHSGAFDPIKGAMHLSRQGDIDGAVWLTFISTHFGKHATDGWKLAKNVYGSFNRGPTWDFATYGNSQNQFENMLTQNSQKLSNISISGRYSNHRKYESKKPRKIAETFRTFYAWQTQYGGFRDLILNTHKRVGQEPTGTFHSLYNSMHSVSRFGGGRLGRFDFLTMLEKLDLAPITPGSVYLASASGPLFGARLLFFNDTDYGISGKNLEPQVDQLDDYLGVGKQVIEDSLCNWQKSPDQYVYFRG
ncbi:hypothetical protein LPB41_23450 [Thalassospira sp. MA62]|nr:hypothetical protein [Thalassospira sp. MA62]